MTPGKPQNYLFRYDVSIHHHFKVFLGTRFSNLIRALKLPFLLYALTHAKEKTIIIIARDPVSAPDYYVAFQTSGIPAVRGMP